MKIFLKIRNQRNKLHQKLDTMLTKRSKWKLYIWLFIGVSLSIMPLLYQATFKLTLGYRLEIAQILPDYVLVAFAITGNLLGIILDSENLFEIRKWFFPVTFFLLLFLVFSLFLSTFNANQELKKGGRKTAQKSRECKYVANKSHKALLRCLR